MAEVEKIKLPEELRKRLEEAVKMEKWLERELFRAEKVGIDVRREKEQFEKSRRLMHRILEEYK
jgi:predicted alpha-1,6-mannanase (GH76 family)